MVAVVFVAGYEGNDVANHEEDGEGKLDHFGLAVAVVRRYLPVCLGKGEPGRLEEQSKIFASRNGGFLMRTKLVRLYVLYLFALKKRGRALLVFLSHH